MSLKAAVSAPWLRHLMVSVISVLVGCATVPPDERPGPVAQKEALPITPPAEIPSSPVVRRPLPEPAVPPDTAIFSPAEVPPGALYVCVSRVNGERKQIAIEFAPKVEQLCRRHPEMGPCQYERDACRRAGGRVYTASGTEITLATEAEYDRRVLRFRFRAN